MSKDQKNLLDYLYKTISDDINEQRLTLDYSLCLIFNVLQPKSPIAKYLLAKVYYMMEFWVKAEFYSAEAISLFELIENRTKFDEDKLHDMYFCKVKAQIFLKKSKEFNESMNILRKRNSKYDSLCKKLDQINSTIDQSLSKYNRSDIDQHDEALNVHESLKKFILNRSQDYYLIPMSWFNRWKAYINFNKHITEANEQHQDCMDEEMEFIGGPGPIIDENLLESAKGEGDFPVFLCDNDASTENFCLSLKPGLIENRDYLMVNTWIFDYLFKKYNGIKLKRSPYLLNESSLIVNLEVYLKPINFLINPLNTTVWNNDEENIFKYRSKTYISKKSTIEELRHSLTHIINLFYITTKSSNLNIRLWKMDPIENLEEYLKQIKNLIKTQKPPYEINAKLLFIDSLALEEADISDEDLILIEIKQEDWFFLTPELQKLENKKKEPALTKAGVNLQELIKYYEIDLKNKYLGDSKYGLVGLQNLGNTCFMNSALQCLINSYKLSAYFIENRFVQEINVKNPLGLKGLNAVTYASLVKDVWQGRKSSVSPWDIKKVISKYSSRFSGYAQQDSQEFVSYLLDGLHEDLNRILNKPVVQEVESKGRPDDVVADESWVGHLKRNDSIIVDLFHGQFKSKITCPAPACGKVSITFDPFQMISLPVPCKEISKTPIYYINTYEKGKVPEKMTLTFNGSSSVSEVKRFLAKQKQINENNLEIYSIQNFAIKEKIPEDKDIKYLIECPGFPFVYDLNSADSDDMGLLQLSISQETSWFYDSKDISYPRMKSVPLKTVMNELHLIVYEMMKPYVTKLWENGSFMNGALNNNNNLNQEYENKIYKDSVYKLAYLSSTSKEKENKRKSGCLLCGKTSCKNCKVPYEANGTTVRDICEDGVLRLEMKFSKNIKKETLELNVYKEVEIKNQESALDNHTISIYDCITQFIQAERLEKGNEWYCSSCKEHKQAYKKMDIYKTSNFLILHLKRFKSSRVSSYGSYFGFTSSTKKINSLISFPLQGLDLCNYILDKKSSSLYDLYAVSNHYGSLEGGHYTAFALNEYDHRWYEFDDAHLRRLSEKDVVTSAAYMLFYRRQETTKN